MAAILDHIWLSTTRKANKSMAASPSGMSWVTCHKIFFKIVPRQLLSVMKMTSFSDCLCAKGWNTCSVSMNWQTIAEQQWAPWVFTWAFQPPHSESKPLFWTQQFFAQFAPSQCFALATLAIFLPSDEHLTSQLLSICLESQLMTERGSVSTFRVSTGENNFWKACHSGTQSQVLRALCSRFECLTKHTKLGCQRVKDNGHVQRKQWTMNSNVRSEVRCKKWSEIKLQATEACIQSNKDSHKISGSGPPTCTVH